MNISHDLGTLLSIAEIAGVFVGFAALVSVIPRRAEASEWFVGSFNLVVLVLTSIVVIVGALVPVAVNRYGFSQSTVWRVSSSMLFVLNWAQILYVGRATQGYRSAHLQRRGLSTVIWSLEPPYQILLLLCIVGLWPDLAPAFYLTALVVALTQVSLIFADLVASLARIGQS
jgi:hypothetical protein